MTRYAVGDIQGCLQPLQCLLEEVSFAPGRDQLWLVGDLVSRGPDSLATLRFLYDLRDSLVVVLGNHDLHTIALARGATDRGRHPTLEALLAAADAPELLDWLRHQPLAYRDPEGHYLMSHAGVPPMWSSEQALALAGEVETVLRGPDIDALLAAMYGNEPARWRDDLEGHDRLRAIINYFTRMRCCRADGELALEFKGSPDQAPEGFAPWFSWPPLNPRRERLLFGHWAALHGATGRDDCIGLDTGCVWGQQMTLLNLDSGVYHRCDCGTMPPAVS